VNDEGYDTRRDLESGNDTQTKTAHRHDTNWPCSSQIVINLFKYEVEIQKLKQLYLLCTIVKIKKRME